MVLYKNRAQAIVYDFADKFFDRNRKVIIPANVCESIPLTYQKMKIPYEIVDIDKDTLSIDMKQIEKKLNMSEENYQAIHYVCTYGNSYDVNLSYLLGLREKYNVKIILDKCLCMPEIEFNKTVLIDMELYSTGYSKCIDFGIGGYAFINDMYAKEIKPVRLNYIKEDYDKMKLLIKQNDWSHIASLNWLESYNLTDIETYISNIKKQYYMVLEHKSRLNDIYRNIIPSNFILPDKFNVWRFNIRLSNSEYVEKKIFENEGLFASRHYKPITLNENNVQKCDNAEKLYSQIMNLFNDFHYDDEKAEKTARIIKEYGILYE